jgi:hypothetical protein
VIRAALPRKRNALTLSLSNQGALEFGKGAHHRQYEICHRQILADQQYSFINSMRTPRCVST